MEMVSALEVDAQRSMLAYADFHANWEARIKAESGLIGQIAPDVVLSNVAYLPLASATKQGIPAVAMCSLNWADIFRYFCSGMPDAADILQQIENAYQQAGSFLRLTPAMPMPWLRRQQTFGLVSQPGVDRRREINKTLGLQENSRLILVSMGGIAMRFPIDLWPEVPGLFWLAPDSWRSPRQDVIAIESLALGFSDLLSSCDAILTKPGYGAFVEAACSGVPVLYVEREAWPEQQVLVDWLSQVGLCQRLEAGQLQTGRFAEELQYLLGQPKPEAVRPSGNEEVAGYLRRFLAD